MEDVFGNLRVKQIVAIGLIHDNIFPKSAGEQIAFIGCVWLSDFQFHSSENHTLPKANWCKSVLEEYISLHRIDSVVPIIASIIRYIKLRRPVVFHPIYQIIMLLLKASWKITA